MWVAQGLYECPDKNPGSDQKKAKCLVKGEHKNYESSHSVGVYRQLRDRAGDDRLFLVKS